MLNLDAKEILSNFESQIALKGHYCLIDVNLIDPNPDQPRTHYPEESLNNLVKSIQENGLLHPIIVKKSGDRYQIIAGERRWRAHLILNKKQIEAIVRTVDDQSHAILALAENIAREDLSDYEIGKAIRSIENNFPNKKDLAAMIGLNRTDMYRYLAFDSLPDFILNDLNINPKLLSRSAADKIKKILVQHKNSDSVLSFLEIAWRLLKRGKLKQTQITRFIEKKLKEVYGINQAATENVLLNENGNQLGRVKQTENYWTVHLNVVGVNEHQREQILNFIRKLLNEQSGSVTS
ncbi:ParB/RepB/Spo0J family partition protein [Methylotuvimicrobium buryatense]|uniref:ParB/RepB/Spo0J family partition protein n=1 Tax=Methylotuvimicrobium buryatense TaxID=95641 RepID=A0A4P9UVB3_METBY|nr:ParB/RepB/Spo0J family partition protein [Methylotuvimicrobium buryatense]QCW83646.1 ParB/RepB/Spo0J family partition protein [Methylotuvimicrobium buryatense]